MFLSPTLAVLLLPAIIAVYLLIRLLRSTFNALPLPPGPRGLPLIGNINDMPQPGTLECHHWLKHKDKYGPISSVTVLNQTFIIVNDSSIALELLRDRAATNSGRPVMWFSGEMIGWKNALAFLQPGETFKMHRKNLAKVAASGAALTVFERVQEEEAAHFLLNVLAEPDDLFAHIRAEAGAVILRITYGYTPEAHGRDRLVELVGQALRDFSRASVPGKWIVDVLPFLRHLPDWCPGSGFKAQARSMAKTLHRTAEIPYAFAKQQWSEKKSTTCYVSQGLKDVHSDPLQEHNHKWSAFSLYAGGADTTVSALMTFFLAMTLFPDVQKKAQEEIDCATGKMRLPVSADKERLPYIEAVIKETHRWHPVVPMSLPHTSNKEDMIRGYRVPKGALIMPNTWWFTHDPATYYKPMEFRPERFINSPTHVAEPDPRTWTFGFGRRVCPGRYVADNALFIMIAQSLAVFDVSKVEENGRTIEPVVAFEPGVLSHPMPYRASIKPRSKEHEALITNAEEEYPWLGSSAAALNMAI